MGLELRPRIRMPDTARRGELVEIKAVVSHPMENGQRRDATGKPIARNIIRNFACRYDGRLVVELALEPSVAANPFIGFWLRADRSASVVFLWTDDHDQTVEIERRLTVT